MRDTSRINTQDKGLDSFGPQETSSSNNPTCCLWLGLIIITRESPHKPAPLSLCLALAIIFCPSWGALPLLIYVEGAGYMTSPSRIRITLLQVES